MELCHIAEGQVAPCEAISQCKVKSNLHYTSKKAAYKALSQMNFELDRLQVAYLLTLELDLLPMLNVTEETKKLSSVEANFLQELLKAIRNFKCAPTLESKASAYSTIRTIYGHLPKKPETVLLDYFLAEAVDFLSKSITA